MTTATKSDDIPIEIVEETTLFHGKWLGARQVIYKHRHPDAVVISTNPPNHESSTNAPPDLTKLPMWQIAYRASKPKTAAVDGVSIVATLIKSSTTGDLNVKEKFLVLVKQFRVPLMKYSLEFPAGLLDANESSMDAALRELREETGYTASRVLGATKGVQSLDPGMTDDSINFVLVEIDGDAEVNRNPTQHLDESERIDVILVPFDRILETFKKLTEEGVYVEAMVYAFGLGTVFRDGLAGGGLVL